MQKVMAIKKTKPININNVMLGRKIIDKHMIKQKEIKEWSSQH